MKRINVKLLAILFVSACVLTVGTYFLWKFQVRRNAEFLVDQAQTAEEKGDFDQAISLRAKYVRLTGFPTEGMEELSNTAIRWTESPNAPLSAYRKAYDILEQTLQQNPDHHELRRRLIDFQLQVNAPQDARQHIEILLPSVSGEEKAELELLLAVCYDRERLDEEALDKLCELTGFDRGKQSFSSGDAAASDNPEAYFRLAVVYESRRNDPQAADVVIQRMRKILPENYMTHRYSGRFRRFFREGEADEALADLKRARELMPADLEEAKHIGLLTELAEVAGKNKLFDEARVVLDDAAAAYPENDRVVDAQVRLAMMEGGDRLDDALAYIDEALRKRPDAGMLRWLKANLLVSKGDYEAVREIVRESREQKLLGAPLLQFLDAQLLIADQKWLQAAEQLEDVRPSLPDADLQLRLDTYLAQCYRRLGRLELAAAAWDRVRARDGTNVAAAIGLAEIRQMLGDKGGAQDLLDQAAQHTNASGAGPNKYLQSTQLSAAVAEQLRKPEGERDWSQVDQLVTAILPRYEPSRRAVLSAEILGHKGELDKAAQILAKSREEFASDPVVWIASSTLAMKRKDFDAAAQLLNQGKQVVGDSVVMRLAEATVIAAGGGEQASDRLRELEQNTDQFSSAERRSLLTRLGSIQMALGSHDQAERLWQEVAKENSGDPTILMALFDLARERNDIAKMQAALADIETLLGEDSAEWRVASAALLIDQVRGDSSQDQDALLTQAREHLAAASKARPEWDKPYRFLAEIDGMQGSVADSVESLKTTLRYKPGDTVTAQRLVALLATTGDFRGADQYIEQAGPGPHTDKFKKLIAEVRERAGRIDEAVEAAAAAVPADSTVAADHIWRGALLSRLEKFELAEEAYRNAIRAEPSRSALWLVLIEHLVNNGKASQAPAVIRDASKHVSPAHAALLTAQALDILGRNQMKQVEADEKTGDPADIAKRKSDANQRIEAAASKFAEASKLAPDDILIQRAVAVHHANRKEFDQMNQALDRMIETAPANPADEERQQIYWARRIRAQYLADSPDYRNFQRAIALLDQNVEASGNLTTEDTLVKALLLARRDEPSLWGQAKQTFEALRARRPLSIPEKKALAQLYHKAGDFEQAQREMLELLADAGDDKQHVGDYIDMLLDQGDFKRAGLWIDKLNQLEPGSLKAYVAMARLADERGNPEKAKEAMRRLTDGLAPEKYSLYLALARQCVELDYHDVAEELYREARAKDPRFLLPLAMYLCERGQFDESFSVFGKAVISQSPPSAQLLDRLTYQALLGMHMNRNKFSERHLGKVEDWIRQGLEVAPDSPVFELRMADLLDLRGKTDEVIQRYEALLARSDLDDVTLATVRNNLAYVYAIKGKELAEAKRLINEAINILGPKGDLLDTRALIHIADGNPRAAVKDLTEATVGNEDPPKLFHLAWAHEQSGNKEQARKLLLAAVENGLSESRLASEELEQLRRLRRELETSG